MPTARAYYQLVAYGDAMYAIGGWNGYEHDKMERYSKGQGWQSMANLPYDNHRSCRIIISLSSINLQLGSAQSQMK